MECLITHTWRKWVLAGVGCLAVLTTVPVQAQRKAKPKEEQAGIGGTLNQGIDESLFTEGMKYIMTDEPTKAIAQFEKLLQKSPNNAAAQYAVASAFLKSGKITEALPYSQKAYQLDNANKYYALQLAEIYVKQKRYGEAETLYEAVLQKSSDNIEYGVELAAIYLFDDKPDKALETYDKVEKVLGPNEEIIRQKQRIYLKQNKVDKAVEEAEKLAAAEPGEPDYLIEGAELLIANDRHQQALSWLEKALKINPDLPQAHVLLADVYRKQGNTDKYRQEIKYLFSNPNLEANIKARILSSYMGMAGENQTAKDDAIKMAQDLVKTNPKDASSQLMMAELLMQTGKKAEARDAFVRAARVDASVFEVWGAIIQLDSDLNQVDSLLVHSEQALEVFPTQGQLWLANGSANLFKRQYQKAIDALEESRRLLVTDAALSRNINAQLGDAYNGLGDHAKSDEAYELVLKADPNNDHVLNNYSYFLSLRKEKLPQALQMSQKLVERNPKNATFLDTHAWVLYVMKDYGKARQYLERAIQADPNNVSGTIMEHYGDVLYQLGEKDKAVEQWKKAKSKGETSEQLDKKIATGKI
ncbi:tetratricopeptide repeat protein [Nibrella saemangeumensis]|uniref:Tetratricopeptide repeat protein n=1 Tax=Nibrella saemangeumensis TaxID=1084526 RepID=A0ABP8MXJ9_9BACT